MGNCLTPGKIMSQKVEKPKKQQQQQKKKIEEEKNQRAELAKEKDSGKGGVRVKIVLTKEQLEWFLVELKNNEGKKNLDDIFGEIERAREKASAWRPSLESITEGSDETVEMNEE